MCGFGGEHRLDGRPADVEAVDRMAPCMRSRGPDAAGRWSDDGVALTHRRLEIIDLSPAGAQPMVDDELGLVLVFNGCVYNYRELRAELRRAGYRFFSTSDTEVVLKAYHRWGTDCVDHLRGMFAFGLVDRRDGGRLVLARDRLGIKPLYITRDTRRVRFASTLPALIAAGDVDTSVDPVALHHYLTFHSVVPPPRTILSGVGKLPPATVRVIEADSTTTDTRYWDPPFTRPADDDRSADEWADTVLDRLRTAVARRTVADVDVGVLLSGGLDSSLVVALLAADGGAGGLSTFSIGFDAAGGEAGDEFRWSDLIAERFGTDHHQIRIPAEEMEPALDDVLTAMSEPMVSHDVMAFHLLSREVSRHVKVVQSGQGADEIFGGYHWYPPMAAANDPLAAYAGAFFDRPHSRLGEEIAAPYLADHDASMALVRARFEEEGADDPVDKALRIDSTVMLVDDPVKRVDAMTMAWGLEARVPFLDHELCELAARVPPEHKLAQGGKGILKDVARLVVPSEVIDRKKGYFPVPALKYISGPVLEMVRDVLGAQAARDRGLFQASYLERLFADPSAHITPLRGSELWQVALLEMWLQTHRV